MLLAGALVTSNKAGLSVPDWPTSFGSLYRIPPMVGGVKYEHSHRMIAEFVGLLTIIATVWTWRADRRRWMRWLGVAALIGVIAQGVLGGMTVRMFLPWYVSTAHAAVAQSFFCLLVLMALFTSRSWIESEVSPLVDSRRPSLYTLCLLALGVLYLQFFFGAAFRHGGMSIAFHLVNAVVTTGVLIWTSVRGMTSPVVSIKLPGRLVHSLLWIQIALGFVAYLTRVRWGANAPQPLPSMVWSTVAHLGEGALLLAATFVLTFEARRCFLPHARLLASEEPVQNEVIA